MNKSELGIGWICVEGYLFVLKVGWIWVNVFLSKVLYVKKDSYVNFVY